MDAAAMITDCSIFAIGFTLSSITVSKIVLPKQCVVPKTTCRLECSNTSAPDLVSASIRSNAFCFSILASGAARGKEGGGDERDTRDVYRWRVHGYPGEMITDRRTLPFPNESKLESKMCGIEVKSKPAMAATDLTGVACSLVVGSFRVASLAILLVDSKPSAGRFDLRK